MVHSPFAGSFAEAIGSTYESTFVRFSNIAAIVGTLLIVSQSAWRLAAQDADTHDHAAGAPHPEIADSTQRGTSHGEHQMLGIIYRSWTLSAMAQAFPILTLIDLTNAGSSLHDSEIYLTQPAVMINLSAPSQRLVLRTTLNLEAETQHDGEYTFGAWGEGFIDKRHPHTFLHEAMVSLIVWNAAGGSFSLSAGKGFAAYGTDDPMSRPAVKYPTNHHLSQILERWTANGVYLHRSGFGLEGSVFGGTEPENPSDLGNFDSFGDSWSMRASQRLGLGFGPFSPWEVSVSYARVEEPHHEEPAVTYLMNAAVRHQARYGFGDAYALVEASRREPQGAPQGYYAILGETKLGLGLGARHRPYTRVEYSTRPEYERAGPLGTDGYYRYDHDAHSTGATRWLVSVVGYAYGATRFPLAVQPFAEIQHNRVWKERGEAEPEDLFGGRSFWSATVGFRVFLGGSMRMGSYGVLDPMAAAMRPGQDRHIH